MSAIFVSHSKRDEDAKRVFSEAFAGLNVAGVFMEYEKAAGKEANRTTIRDSISASSAMFVILSRNVRDVPYTRDWVTSESGAACNKDVWVFEPVDQIGEIDVVVPWARHYAVYNNSNDFFQYLRQIIISYDDTNQLATALLGTGVGTAVGYAVAKKEKGLGATVGGVLGFMLGFILSNKSRVRPPGLGFTCSHCQASYDVHLMEGTTRFRCPVCNTIYD